MEGSMGSAARMAEVMRGSIKNQIEVLKSSLTELGFKFIEAFRERGSETLNSLIETVQRIDPAKVINFLSWTLDRIVSLGKFLKDWEPAILTAYAAFKTFKGVTGILSSVSGALLELAIKQEGAGLAAAAMKTALQAATLEQWALNAATAFPVAIIAAGTVALWKLGDIAAKAYNKIETAVPGSKGYNNMNPGRQRRLWADYNASMGRAAEWRPTDEDPREFERDARGVFVLKDATKMTDAEKRNRAARAKNNEEMSEFEKLMLELQKRQAALQAEIAANTEPQNGPAKSLNYSLAGIGDIWEITRRGM